MKTFKSIFTPEQISGVVKGQLVLRNTVSLRSVAELDEADSSSICFYQNKSFYQNLLNSKAGLIFVPEDFEESIMPATNLLKVANPYIYFMMLVQKWLELDEPDIKPEISNGVDIAPSAKIAENVEIGSNTVISEGVVVGKGCRIGANCFIGNSTVLGNDCRIFSGVMIYDEMKIGNEVILHSGVVIGADGFGFLLHEKQQFKLPQVGNVVIHDKVEIGANSCVDRATLGSTVIGFNTKIDNLVQIGHNCVIGENSIICAQVGLAGNTRIGDRVYLAGQVGSAGHIEIGNDVLVGAQSGVAGNVKAGSKVFGYPARDAGLTKRIMAAEKQLPEIVKHYRKLIKESKQDERK